MLDKGFYKYKNDTFYVYVNEEHAQEYSDGRLLKFTLDKHLAKILKEKSTLVLPKEFICNGS